MKCQNVEKSTITIVQIPEGLPQIARFVRPKVIIIINFISVFSFQATLRNNFKVVFS